VRQGLGGNNSTFVTVRDETEAPRCYNLRGERAAADAPLPAGTHDVRVLKATEADWNAGSPLPNYLTFSGIEAAGGAAALPQPPLPARRLEFLGDSITAGFCNTDCVWGDRLADNKEAFGASWDAQLGALLDAQIHTAAWSGLGMVHNCCGGNTTMPSIFGRTLATVNTDRTWDWARWIPDALVVNLGTNDGAAASTDPAFVAAYTELVLQAREHYGPQLHVFLACGPMSNIYCEPVQQVLATVKAEGVLAHFLDHRGLISRCDGSDYCTLDWSHCCGHPDVPVDTAMAAAAAPILERALGW
jgi:lysophospholipase L1-like esterase